MRWLDGITDSIKKYENITVHETVSHERAENEELSFLGINLLR